MLWPNYMLKIKSFTSSLKIQKQPWYYMVLDLYTYFYKNKPYCKYKTITIKVPEGQKIIFEISVKK